MDERDIEAFVEDDDRDEELEEGWAAYDAWCAAQDGERELARNHFAGWVLP